MAQFKVLDSTAGNGNPWIMVDFRRSPGRPGKHEAAAPSRRIGVLVPLELLTLLERIAAIKSISRHAAIREALAAYVEAELRHDKAPPKRG